MIDPLCRQCGMALPLAHRRIGICVECLARTTSLTYLTLDVRPRYRQADPSEVSDAATTPPQPD